MPAYDFLCPKCGDYKEVVRRMDDNSTVECDHCESTMEQQWGSSFNIQLDSRGTRQDQRTKDRQKKIKDPERAIRARKKMFGSDSVGNPVDKPDPKKVIQKKIINQKEATVSKKDFIKQAAKNPETVRKAQEILKKKS